MNLAGIKKMIADYQPPPDPFNGATTLYLAPGVASDMYDVVDQYARNPMMGRFPTIEVRPVLPAGHGYGVRDWRDGDDVDLRGIPTVVWVLAPKEVN